MNVWRRFANLPRWFRDCLLPVALMALIFFLSSRPGPVDTGSEAADFSIYKSVHFIVYAILTWLCWRALSPRRECGWQALLAAAAVAALFGAVDEVHQLSVPSRTGRLTDVFLNASGALAMVLLLRRFPILRSFPEALGQDGTEHRNND